MAAAPALLRASIRVLPMVLASLPATAVAPPSPPPRLSSRKMRPMPSAASFARSLTRRSDCSRPPNPERSASTLTLMVTSLLMVHLPPLLVRPAAEPLYLQQAQQFSAFRPHLAGQFVELPADAE